MTETFFYKFKDQREFNKYFEKYFIEGFYHSEDFAIDVIGLIYSPTGTLIGEGTEAYEEHLPIPGFHVNTTSRIEGLEGFEIFPVTPYRVFA